MIEMHKIDSISTNNNNNNNLNTINIITEERILVWMTQILRYNSRWINSQLITMTIEVISNNNGIMTIVTNSLIKHLSIKQVQMAPITIIVFSSIHIIITRIKLLKSSDLDLQVLDRVQDWIKWLHHILQGFISLNGCGIHLKIQIKTKNLFITVTLIVNCWNKNSMNMNNQGKIVITNK